MCLFFSSVLTIVKCVGTWGNGFVLNNIVLPLKLTEDFLFASVIIKPCYNHTQSAQLWGKSSLPMMISTVTFDALQLFGTSGMHLFVIQPAYYHDVNKFRLETNVTILCSLPLVEKRVAFGQYAMCVLGEFPLFGLVLFNVYTSQLSHLLIASCKRGCSEPFGRCNGDDICDCQNDREGLQCQLNTGLPSVAVTNIFGGWIRHLECFSVIYEPKLAQISLIPPVTFCFFFTFMMFVFS
jgi:hypothetical protein